MTLEERVKALEDTLGEVLRILEQLTDVPRPSQEDQHKAFAERVRKR